VVKTVQTSFYKSYKKWDEATEEGEQLYQLVAFYDAYIAKDLKQLIYKKSASKSSYSSSKKPSYSSSKKGSSYSSYNDYDDYGSSSGSSGSSWGGGSFGGGGGSDDW
jgi:hypothetical protein